MKQSNNITYNVDISESVLRMSVNRPAALLQKIRWNVFFVMWKEEEEEKGVIEEWLLTICWCIIQIDEKG